jgi:hypothetical protein
MRDGSLLNPPELPDEVVRSHRCFGLWWLGLLIILKEQMSVFWDQIEGLAHAREIVTIYNQTSPMIHSSATPLS